MPRGNGQVGEMKRRRLTRRRTEFSDPDFSLIAHEDGSPVFPDKTNARSLEYPHDFETLKDWFISRDHSDSQDVPMALPANQTVQEVVLGAGDGVGVDKQGLCSMVSTLTVTSSEWKPKLPPSSMLVAPQLRVQSDAWKPATSSQLDMPWPISTIPDTGFNPFDQGSVEVVDALVDDGDVSSAHSSLLSSLPQEVAACMDSANGQAPTIVINNIDSRSLDYSRHDHRTNSYQQSTKPRTSSEKTRTYQGGHGYFREPPPRWQPDVHQKTANVDVSELLMKGPLCRHWASDGS